MAQTDTLRVAWTRPLPSQAYVHGFLFTQVAPGPKSRTSLCNRYIKEFPIVRNDPIPTDQAVCPVCFERYTFMTQADDALIRFPVLSVKQPWAAALVLGIKTVENRKQPLFGPMKDQVTLIHASLKEDMAEEPYRTMLAEAYAHEVSHLYGHIIGGVVFRLQFDPQDHLNPQVEDFPGDRQWWQRECYGWVCVKPFLLREPILAKGKLGLWYAEIHKSSLPVDFLPNTSTYHHSK